MFRTVGYLFSTPTKQILKFSKKIWNFVANNLERGRERRISNSFFDFNKSNGLLKKRKSRSRCFHDISILRRSLKLSTAISVASCWLPRVMRLFYISNPFITSCHHSFSMQFSTAKRSIVTKLYTVYWTEDCSVI